MTVRPSARLRIASALLAALFVVAFGTACQKTPAELTSEALTRAQTAHNAGKNDEAIKGYYETLGNDPRNEIALTNLGIIYRFANKPQIAEGFYRAALEVNPNSAGSLFGLAVIRAAAGDTQEAIDLYRRLLVLNPNDAIAHYNLGLVLRATGRVAEGDAEIRQAIAIDPKLPPAPAATPVPTQRPSPSPTGR
ncbi:MAG TPA: tetratricopeptide repeat protein [Candidatus Limnocylindria bacterium]|nr:tetratricopeptide repeat protein [Candidatus Limnocylindria bacterium]